MKRLRLLAWVLAAVMCVSMASVAAFADDDPVTVQNEGIKDNVLQLNNDFSDVEYVVDDVEQEKDESSLAQASMTQDEAIAWAVSMVGKSIDMDGVPVEQPYQCVDLIKAYYQALGASPVRGNGADYSWNDKPADWERVAGGQPQKGDILVYAGYQGWSKDGKRYVDNLAGHVAIYESDYCTYHQNFSGGYVEKITTIRYDGFDNPYWGYIRPNWPPRKGEPIEGGNQTIPDGKYHIISALDDNMGLDVDGNKSEDGTNVDLYANTADDNQTFTVKFLGDGFYSIMHTSSEKYLDVAGASLYYETNVQIFTWNNSPAQKWVIRDTGDGYYFNILSNCNGLCLDVSGGQTKNYTNIQVFGSNGTNAQRWRFVPAEPLASPGVQTITDGYYHIVSALDNSLGLDVAGNNSEDGTNVQIYANTADDKQAFQIKYLGDGFYSIVHRSSGKYLDVFNGSLMFGANVDIYTSNNTDSQKWVIKDTGDGQYYNIISKRNGLCLDVSGGQAKNFINVQMFGDNGTKAQKWKFIAVSNCDLNGHSAGNAVRENEVKATCESEGKYDEVTYCSVCGVELNRTTKTTKPLGHDFSDNAQYCRNGCGTKNPDYSEPVEPCTHQNTEVRNKKDATCTEDGYTGDTYCKDCGELVTKGTAIKATGHDFSDNAQYCRHNCGAVNPDYKPDDPVNPDNPVDKKIDISLWTVEGIEDLTYTGKKLIQSDILVSKDGEYADVKIKYKNNVNVGTATMTITGTGDYTGEIVETFEILRASNKAKKVTSTKTLQYSKLKKKNQTFNIAASVQENAKKTYKIASVSSKAKKYVSVSSAGKVTVKKGLKKGTYSLKVKITAAETANYKKTTVTKSIKLVVK